MGLTQKQRLEKIIIIAWMTMLFGLLVDGQRLTEKKRGSQSRIVDSAKNKTSAMRPAAVEIENICDQSISDSISAFCKLLLSVMYSFYC